MRLSRFVCTYDGNEAGDLDAAIIAGSPGMRVYKFAVSWEPHAMTGSSNELQYLAIGRYAGVATGTAGVIDSFNDSVTSLSSLVTSVSALTVVKMIQVLPGSAQY